MNKIKQISFIALSAMALFFVSCANSAGGSSSSNAAEIQPGTLKYSVDITLNANGGTISTSSISEEVDSPWYKLPKAETLGLSKSGYTFVGWVKESTATESLYSDGAQIEIEGKKLTLSLYAIWRCGIEADRENVASLIRNLTADSTVVVKGYLESSDYTAIANALKACNYKVVLDFSSISASSSGIGMELKDCTKLKGLVLPKSQVNFFRYYIDGCSNIESIDVASESSNFSSVDGVLYNKDKSQLRLYPVAKTTENPVIPDTVTEIYGSAMKGNTHIKTITFPDSLTKIGISAFENCTGLTAITFTNNSQIQTIETDAFTGCTALATATFPTTSRWKIEGTEATSFNAPSVPGDTATMLRGGTTALGSGWNNHKWTRVYY